jgi:hypothetical protein
VAIISTAELHRREDRPFTFDPGDCYRIIPGDVKAADLVMSHISTNFDHSGFQQDRYDLAVQKRGRTTVGVSKIDLDGLGDFICSFLGGEIPENPRDDIALPYTLNLATDDLKAYYSEAMTAQPGQESPSSKVLSDGFYGETMAGKVLFAIQDLGRESDDLLMKILANVLVIPAAQVEKRMKMSS